MLGLTRYQWTVLAAAWLGWGFDLFDSILFNFVAPNCVPTLLDLPIGSPEAKQATLYWTGILTALLLLGWAAGGILFGYVGDRIGRTRTMQITIAMYALGTAACAFAPSIEWLLVFRLIAALGIGGEWAAGAAMVAEVMPENRRIEAGALLYTSAAFGTTLATVVNFVIAGWWLADQPEISWRYVFLCGLLPALVILIIRLFLKEPERWVQARAQTAPPRLRELFTPQHLRATRSGLMMALIALITWWSCNAFLPTFVTALAQTHAAATGLERAAMLRLTEDWKFTATMAFNLGGLIGTLLTVPVAKHLGRRPMFALYFAASIGAILLTFGTDVPPQMRLYFYFAIGLSVFGVFGSFTYYLPELFPTRLRATGAGFCYNAGRVIAAVGPFVVGAIAARGAGTAVEVLVWVAVIPAIGLLLMPWVVETRGRPLPD
ncbi:Major Facilitator Superfamily protein [Fontimonas thermophila]|uniref:Major Facilitator Superfamily protein n=1 Tax=Fontimonas thermophila TaxID=1076937 RepID=A0A1I2H132_9GAMM|nr:MFS transporter [Fontimonas thermophila]SFF23083.1 Major Facilitator Superfamily protein [Fontimonas thermophila]